MTRPSRWIVMERDPPSSHWCWRRFGRNHDKPCRDPQVLTCAFSECQLADQCQQPEKPPP